MISLFFRYKSFLPEEKFTENIQAVIETTALPGQREDAFYKVGLTRSILKKKKTVSKYFWVNLPTSSWGSLFSTSENSCKKEEGTDFNQVMAPT